MIIVWLITKQFLKFIYCIKKCHVLRFPKDETRNTEWKIACGISLCLPTSKICFDHFLPEDYELSGLLKKSAVPWYYFVLIVIYLFVLVFMLILMLFSVNKIYLSVQITRLLMI